MFAYSLISIHQVLDHSINLRTSRPGTEIKVPYELTLTESLHDFWQSSFHSQDRVHTSTPFARALGLQDRVMPFSLVLFLTSAMSHEDAAKVQVGFGKCVYCWPVFAGDTVRKTFQVKSVRNTSDGNHSVSLCLYFVILIKFLTPVQYLSSLAHFSSQPRSLISAAISSTNEDGFA